MKQLHLTCADEGLWRQPVAKNLYDIDLLDILKVEG
jgi:hypothetical protein